MKATLEGTAEVMPALLASMLTSVAIFLPILFMEGLEGQLFKDRQSPCRCRTRRRCWSR